MPGTLVFRPIEANLNVKDKDAIGKMDPYCLFHVGGHRVKSQVCQSGGNNPHWNDSVSCQMPETGGFVTVDVKDKDMLIDDKLGSFELDLNEVASLGQVRKWYPIFSKDRPAGEILIETTFSGSGHGHGLHQQQGYTNQQFTGVPTTQYSNQHFTGVPTTQSTYVKEVHPLPERTYTTEQVSYQHVPVQSNQPLHFSGVQANVIPVGGVPTSTEQYAVEALMRGVDPMNSQQHYQYNVLNGSTNPGFTGIPMNYSSGLSNQSIHQNPTSLTQTPLYSGSQPMMYQGEEAKSTILSNTRTTGHHNEGFVSNMELQSHKMDQKMNPGHHHNPVESKNLNTGDFRKI